MVLHELTRPDDPRLAALASLLQRTFSDPNSVLGLDRLQEFLAADPHAMGRSFHVLVGEDDNGRVIGGSVFSYVPRANCGFSEYLVLEPEARGRGVGRMLFDRRRQILDDLAARRPAATSGALGCNGLFIEVDSPERSPPDMLAAERESAMDVHQRLRVFDHLGFRRVDLAYVQPPLGPNKAAVTYLDLLFAPWHTAAASAIPVAWIVETLEPIWRAWTASSSETDAYLSRLRDRFRAASLVGLMPL